VALWLVLALGLMHKKPWHATTKAITLALALLALALWEVWLA
jgi:hypothetical protein